MAVLVVLLVALLATSAIASREADLTEELLVKILARQSAVVDYFKLHLEYFRSDVSNKLHKNLSKKIFAAELRADALTLECRALVAELDILLETSTSIVQVPADYKVFHEHAERRLDQEKLMDTHLKKAINDFVEFSLELSESTLEYEQLVIISNAIPFL
jgi:hypothetical protein